MSNHSGNSSGSNYSVKDIVNSHTEELLKNNFISSKKEISFYLPGTPVRTVHGKDNISIDDYTISKVTFGVGERTPYYTLRKFYKEDSENNIMSHYFTELNEPNFTVHKPYDKAKVKVDWGLVNKENVGYLNNEQVFDGVKLDSEKHLWLNTVVLIKLEELNNKTKFHFISSVSIDNDLNIYYCLDKNNKKFYVADELTVCLCKHITTPTKDFNFNFITIST